MSIKNPCILSILLFIIPLCVTAKPDSVILTGRLLDTAKNGDDFTCKILRPGTPLYGQVAFTDSYSATIKKNCFRLALPSLYDWFDVTFCTTNKKGRENLLNGGNGLEMSYTVQKGDQLQLLVRLDGSIDFSGTNASRLRCQQNIMSLGYLPLSAIETLNDLNNWKKYTACDDFALKFLDKQTEMKEAVLSAYRDSLPAFIYKRFGFDVIGQSYRPLLFSLSALSRGIDTPGMIAAKQFLKRLEINMPAPDSSAEAIASPYYADALLFKAVDEIAYSGRSGSPKKVVLKDLLHLIGNEYIGALRDKLIFLSFLNFGKTDPEAAVFLDKAGAEMKNDQSKDLLQEWSRGMRTGAPSYPFDLSNEKGERFTLKDFRGKVIVVDFWFTGCEGCAQIPAAMTNVCKKYAHNKRVVFLSVNVDRKRVMWDLGLKSGQYTIPGAIHLSLTGLGFVHPFLKYYNYTSFPALLMIGPDGKTVTAYAPDPRLDNGQKLIEMIDAQLHTW